MVTRFIVLLSAAAVAVGCAGQISSRGSERGAPRGVTLEMVRADAQESSFVLSNRSNRPFQYRHWTGQGSRPVLSIEATVDGKIERRDEWPIGADDLLVTHEELLFPGETIEFSVSGEALHRVGVIYWDKDSEQQVSWSAVVER